MTTSCILQLEELVIESCDRMEQVFIWNEGENQSNIHIPKLKILILDSLPKLTSFCKATESFEFPLLNQKRISRCPLLKNFVCTDWSPEDHDDDYTHLFCKPDNKENMKLKLQGNMSLGRNRIQECVEYMSLERDGSTSLDFGVAQSMRCLTLREFSMNMATIATVFPLLEVLCLVNITDLEEIRDIIDGHGPKNLNELRLKSLSALKHLWQISSGPSKLNGVSIFNQLSCIYIYGCDRLFNLFPLSMMARSCVLQLERLVIESCEMIEHIFWWNEEDKQRNIDPTQVFSELKSLSLKSLPKLTSLCKGIESVELPQLTQIQLEDCPLLKENVFSMNLFFEPDKVKMDIWNNQPFRNAEYLSLEGNAYTNSDVREVQNMRWLTFRECLRGTKLVNVTTMDTLFPQLEVLRLVKLPELEEIWEIDGPIQSNSFKNLKELRLEFVPALKHLWQSNSSPSQMNVVSIFSNLSSLYIYGCHQLYNLFSLPETETDSCLLQLEKLVIESCDRMEHIFFWNEGENKNNIHIPKLKVLILDSLPKLTCFCRGIKSFEFPSLDQKRISRCPLLENFVSTDNHDDDYMHIFCKPDYNKVEQKMELKLQGNITLGRNRIQHCVEYMSLEGDCSTSLDFVVAQSIRCLSFGEFSMGTKLMNMTIIATLFPLLKVLSLVKITELEEIWDIDGHGPKNLNELRLKSMPALKHLWQSSSSPSQMNAVSIFSKLSSIYIHGCHELCNLFSLPVTDTGSCVLQLENLVIESCEMMEHVFLWNGKESQRSIVFPKLKVLKLDSLLSLTSFCEGMESFEFPLLVEMRISGCPLLRNLVFTESPTDDDDGKPDKKKIELWMNQLFRKVTYLSLEGDNYRDLDLKLADQNMLSFKELSTEMKLLNVTTIDTLFPRLEILKLVELTELVEIWEFDGPIRSTSFKNLKELKLEFLKRPKHLWLSTNSPYQMTVVSIFNQLSSIYIYGCDGLCNLFSLSMMPRGSCLSQLERLQIESCKNMEQVFLWNEEKNIHVQEFPKLKFVSLSFLPKLKNICKGVKRIQCPQLDKMKIVNCPKLESLVYWHKDRLPFIFNSSRYALERGRGANTALQPHMLRREEQQQQQQQKEVEEEQRKTITEGGRRCEIEEEPDS